MGLEERNNALHVREHALSAGRSSAKYSIISSTISRGRLLKPPTKFANIKERSAAGSDVSPLLWSTPSLLAEEAAAGGFELRKQRSKRKNRTMRPKRCQTSVLHLRRKLTETGHLEEEVKKPRSLDRK